MNFSLHCDLIGADGVIFSGLAQMVIVRSSIGELGISFGHAPLLSDVIASNLRIINPSGETLIFRVSDGFLEVQNNMVKILTAKVEEGYETSEPNSL